MRPSRPATIALTMLVLAGCRDETSAPGKPAAPRPFTPPAHGIVTTSQVEAWLAVRERARDHGESDGQAAQALGKDPREVAWVGERIGEARRLTAGRSLEERVAAARARFRAGLAAERPTASPERRAEIDRLLAEFPPAVGAGAGPAARNAEVIAPFAERLEAALAPSPNQMHQVEKRAGR